MEVVGIVTWYNDLDAWLGGHCCCFKGAAPIVELVAFFRYLTEFSESFRVCFDGSYCCLRQTGLSFPVDEKKAKISLNHTFLAQAYASPPMIEQGQRFFFGSNLSLLQNINTFYRRHFGMHPVLM